MDRDKFLGIAGTALTASFTVSFLTGIVKFPELKHFFTSVYLVLDAGLISLVHDYAGLATIAFFFIHLFLRRGWLNPLLGAGEAKQ